MCAPLTLPDKIFVAVIRMQTQKTSSYGAFSKAAVHVWAKKPGCNPPSTSAKTASKLPKQQATDRKPPMQSDAPHLSVPVP